jgi:hypothetical protein
MLGDNLGFITGNSLGGKILTTLAELSSFILDIK